MATTKEKGDKGELFVQGLLAERGYSSELLKTNFPTYDIKAFGERSFSISVKTSNKKQHVRFGNLTSVNRLSEGNFVFALMPNRAEEISFVDDGYQLLIIPAEIAKRDAIYVHETYHGKKGYSVIVKGYSSRGPQREVWARWKQFENAWHLLPDSTIQHAGIDC